MRGCRKGRRKDEITEVDRCAVLGDAASRSGRQGGIVGGTVMDGEDRDVVEFG